MFYEFEMFNLENNFEIIDFGHNIYKYKKDYGNSSRIMKGEIII